MHEDRRETALSIDALDVSYPGKEVLRNLSLHVARGEIYGLLGRNGAGKTTLLNALMRLIEPIRGRIAYWGEEIHSVPTKTWRRISYLGEMAGVLPHWTVRRIVAFQRESYGRLRQDWTERLLGEYGIDTRMRMRALSRGQQQMVGLILAIAVEPDLLLLDEPAAGMDPVARRKLLANIFDLMGNRKCATLITSHVISDIERLVDRVGFLSRGRIILEGQLDDLKDTCALLRWGPDEPLPRGLECLRARDDGHMLVAGDLSAVSADDVERLSLEDLYVELLGHGREG